MADFRNSRRILVLDDDELMRELLDTLLSLQGYRVTLADSGTAALHVLRESEPFYLVLTDLQLPQLAGEALALRLRAAMPPESLLIGMSARPALDGERRVLDAFLRKPFDITQFETAVRAGQGEGADSSADLSASQGSAEASGTPVKSPEGPALNEDIFASLAKMLPLSQLMELYDLTLSDVAKRHARMEALAAEGDLPALRREAHAVKGACGMVGATELQAVAAAVEDGTTLNTAAISKFPVACDRLRRMLDAKLQTA